MSIAGGQYAPLHWGQVQSDIYLEGYDERNIGYVRKRKGRGALKVVTGSGGSKLEDAA